MKTYLCAIAFFATIGCLSSCKKATPSGCGTPTGSATRYITAASATAGWNAPSGAQAYTIQYHQLGSAIWIASTVSTDSMAIYGLNSGTTYEWRVETICASGVSAFTAPSVFTTDTEAVYRIYATVRGLAQTFTSANPMIGSTTGSFTTITGRDASVQNGIDIRQDGETSATVDLATTPATTYIRIGNTGAYYDSRDGYGTMTRTISGNAAAITFSGVFFNTSPPYDSVIVTNGSYSGPITH